MLGFTLRTLIETQGFLIRFLHYKGTQRRLEGPGSYGGSQMFSGAEVPALVIDSFLTGIILFLYYICLHEHKDQDFVVSVTITLNPRP